MVLQGARKNEDPRPGAAAEVFYLGAGGANRGMALAPDGLHRGAELACRILRARHGQAFSHGRKAAAHGPACPDTPK